MPEWKDLHALVWAWLLIAVVGAVVTVALHRYIHRAGPILPPQRRRAVPWTGAHVFLAFLIFYFVPAFILPYIHAGTLTGYLHGPDTDPVFARYLAYSAASLMALPLQVGLWYGLGRLADGPRSVFGVVPRRIPADVTAAYWTWLVLTPVVYAVNFAALIAYTWIEFAPPIDHPAVRVLHAGPGSPSLYVLLFAQAVLAAPIAEELFFRGIVQPFLAEGPWRGSIALVAAAFVGVVAHSPVPLEFGHWKEIVTDVPVLFVLVVLPLYWWGDTWVPARLLPVHDPIARQRAVRAIVATAILFANAHANVWPTPIPLFVLALGLGWLAYRTQAIFAPIVLHMLFNTIVFLTLGWPPSG